MKILITGGAGYIGSHTCVELLNSDFELIVFDNLSNSKLEALDRVERITGKTLDFVEGDVRDREQLRSLFKQYNIDSVIHFAGLKANRPRFLCITMMSMLAVLSPWPK
jgi:UDP-glucose 4-epimerase